MMDLVAIDIGNSLINIGFFRGKGLIIQRVNTYPLRRPSGYVTLINNFIKEKNIDKTPAGVIICSVVPSHIGPVKEACAGLFRKKVMILTHKLKTGLHFQIKKPEKLGTDRIAASVGACDLFGTPVVVIDFGTATNLNFIGAGNMYKGGAIMPGVGLMKNALFRETAQLPDVSISGPSTPLGRDTKECILSGIIYGTAGAVERIIEEVKGREKEGFKMVITGGYAELISPFLKMPHYIEQALVLKGLKSIFERNKNA